jgi:mannose-6-phosphate isomerase-like protein (cupin superfamily)
VRVCQGKVWRNGYGSIGKGKLCERGASGGELPWQAGTRLHTGGQRTERRLPGHLARLGDASSPGRTKAHLHENHETALYLISGDEVEVYTGEQLEHREVARAGDYIYIPAGVPHVAVNRTETPAAFLAARTDPNEQESVVMRPDLEDKVP